MIACYDKIRIVATHLNTERAAMGIGFRFRGKKIVHFFPCEKSLVYLAALPGAKVQPALNQPPYSRVTSDWVLSEIENLAALIVCECHPGMTAAKLMEYEYTN